MKNALGKAVCKRAAKLSVQVAKAARNPISWFGWYQPKEPAALRTPKA